MPLHPDMSIHERIEILTAALATVLDRGTLMSVEPSVVDGPELYVGDGKNGCTRERYSIERIARELELLLS